MKDIKEDEREKGKEKKIRMSTVITRKQWKRKTTLDQYFSEFYVVIKQINLINY